ncbi:MAG TPA: DnaJ C-terminal domain-containing protein, partial [Actinospica sp.]|nr:DnaJ C-terminal domain-containing protein [Actinospica sp.]
DPNAEDKFKEAAEAYEILSDRERRATYDRYGHDGLRSGGFSPNFDSFGSVADIFEAFFGGGGGGFASAFGSGFGGGGGGRSGPVQGPDVQLSAEIDLGQAARGTQLELDYEAVILCEHCRGNGAEPGTRIDTCPRCGGTGQLRTVSRTPFGQVMRAAACDQCGGDGRLPTQPCRSCEGRGRRIDHVRVSVEVPAGIASGQRIRVGGRGHAGEHGGPPGDLYVLIGVRDDPRFLRDGDDLLTTVDVSAPLAAIGTTVEVPTLGGPLELEVPAGTQPGAILIHRGGGMPSLRGRRPGDLRVVVNVVVPRRLNREQRELHEKLARTLTEENLRSEEGMFAKLKRVLHG